MFTESGRKQYPDHENPPADSSLVLMAELVGSSKRVLDIGCANGSLARLLVAQGCEATGVDASPAAAEMARLVCRDVVVADLDVEPLNTVVAGAPFDVIVFGDVLEHLRNPLALLESARSLLADDAYIVASIPNVAHGAVRLAMMNGGFDYQEYGLLDETHLRFFTKRSVEGLMDAAGFRIETLLRTRVALFEESDLVPAVRRDDYAADVVESILRDPEHDTLQFVIRAYPISHDARLRVLAKRASDAEAAHDTAERAAAILREELAALRSANRGASDRMQELERERSLHVEARDRADRVIEASAERIGDLQRRLDALDAAVRALQADEAGIEARLADSLRRNSELESEREALARDLGQQQGAYDDLRTEARVLQADLLAAVNDREALATEHQALESRVVDVLDEMTEKMRRESEVLAAEIESVQAGFTWRLRTALRTLLRRH